MDDNVIIIDGETLSTKELSKPTTKAYKHDHDATKPITIGGKSIWLGAERDIPPDVVSKMDLIIPLNGNLPSSHIGELMHVLSCEMNDMGGVPLSWEDIVKYISEAMDKDYKVLAYCTGGHGRTGTLGASLIAVREPDVDPIDAIRERHCERAVESNAQMEGIYKLKGEVVPEKHKKTTKSYGYSSSSQGGEMDNVRMEPDKQEVAILLKQADDAKIIFGWNMPYGKYGNVKIWMDISNSQLDIKVSQWDNKASDFLRGILNPETRLAAIVKARKDMISSYSQTSYTPNQTVSTPGIEYVPGMKLSSVASSNNQRMTPSDPEAEKALLSGAAEHLIGGWNMPNGKDKNVRVWLHGKGPDADEIVLQKDVPSFIQKLREAKRKSL